MEVEPTLMLAPKNAHSFFALRALRVTALIILFGLAFGIRLFDLTDLPLDFHPTRQLLSALKARGMFYQTAPGIPDWQRQMSLQQWRTRSAIEPEVVERLVAFTYQFTGEQVWVARIYSSLFWVIGGVFLFFLIKDLISVDGAMVATAYYLFLPYAVIASRAFQPDPLMVMLIIVFWWAFHRWSQKPSWIFAILAGLFGGFAIFIKFVAAFFVMGGALGELLGNGTRRNTLRNTQVWLIIALGILPGASYLFYGVVLNDFLGQKFSGRFIPSLLFSPRNYIGWASKADLAAGGVAIMLGLLGLFLIRERRVRNYLIGLWIAYILFGLYFNYTIATHDYYQEPFIPLVAISLAPVADWTMARLAEVTVTRWMRTAVFIVLLYGVATTAWNVRGQLKLVNYRPQAAMWEEIGMIFNRKSNVVALTQDYGNRLDYWGWQNTRNWPYLGDINSRKLRGKSFEFDKSFDNLTQGKQYFLVTDFTELGRQPQLQQQLVRLPVYKQGEGYVIYELSDPSNPESSTSGIMMPLTSESC
jgi:4-amino-4-deoxy-L-arabinose transferase-like glycosyltransferase